MELVYFTVVAVVLYFVSDWILRVVESGFGRTFEHRTLIFFGILLTLALISFWIIREFAAS